MPNFHSIQNTLVTNTDWTVSGLYLNLIVTYNNFHRDLQVGAGGNVVL